VALSLAPGQPVQGDPPSSPAVGELAARREAFERARDGSELETIGVTYVLRKTESEWKIAVIMRIHPPCHSSGLMAAEGLDLAQVGQPTRCPNPQLG
jgi:hypothetical protein